MKVGEAIQHARKRAGMTQEQLAAQVYVTRQAVSRWENGESEPGVDMRKLLASALDVPVLVDFGYRLPVCARDKSAASVPYARLNTSSSVSMIAGMS